MARRQLRNREARIERLAPRRGGRRTPAKRDRRRRCSISFIFAFLTTEPNKIVGAIHLKAMPVILTTREEIDTWMTASLGEAVKLQRPLADDALMIVARGEKKDEGGLAT